MYIGFVASDVFRFLSHMPVGRT